MRALLCACRESLGGAFSCGTLHMHLSVPAFPLYPPPRLAAPTGRSSRSSNPTRRLGVLADGGLSALMRSPAQSALRFTASSPAAVVLTVWPSGTGELATVRAWLEDAAARVVHEQPVPLKTELAELLTVMALYEGEEWVESNCWYSEQPLPTGPHEGPYAGAKWKRALCFRNAAASRAPHCFVLDVSPSPISLLLGSGLGLGVGFPTQTRTRTRTRTRTLFTR
jgi:hypothetical protein